MFSCVDHSINHKFLKPLNLGLIRNMSSSGSGSDSGSEDDTPPPVTQPQVKTKVLDSLHFSQFLRDHQAKIISNSVIKDEYKSTNRLVQEAESEKIISSPREYQTELFERAKQKNIIAVLDTGMLFHCSCLSYSRNAC